MVVGLVNALLWPLVVRVALPLTVLTLGIGALVLDGALTLLAAAVVPGVELDGLGSGDRAPSSGCRREGRSRTPPVSC